MAFEPATKLYEMYHDAAGKGEHLLTGIIAAIVAYLWRDYSPCRLGYNVTTLNLLGILSLTASLVFALLRLDKLPAILALMSDDSAEDDRRFELIKAGALGKDAVSGQHGRLSLEDQQKEVARIDQRRKTLREQMDGINKKCARLYRWRNRLLVAGLCFSGAAKVLSPYLH